MQQMDTNGVVSRGPQMRSMRSGLDAQVGCWSWKCVDDALVCQGQPEL